MCFVDALERFFRFLHVGMRPLNLNGIRIMLYIYLQSVLYKTLICKYFYHCYSINSLHDLECQYRLRLLFDLIHWLAFDWYYFQMRWMQLDENSFYYDINTAGNMNVAQQFRKCARRAVITSACCPNCLLAACRIVSALLRIHYPNLYHSHDPCQHFVYFCFTTTVRRC